MCFTLAKHAVTKAIFIKIYNNTSSLYSDKILLIMFLPGIDMIRLFFIRIKRLEEVQKTLKEKNL